MISEHADDDDPTRSGPLGKQEPTNASKSPSAETQQAADSPARRPQRSNDGPSSSDGPSRPWMRMAGLGIELAGYTLGLAAIGIVVDSRLGQATPYATAAGALVGFSYGMFRFIQKATGGN